MLTERLKNSIKDYPDFPKKDIIFKDISPVIADPELFSDLIEKISQYNFFKNTDAIIAIDARGFIFGSGISLAAKKPMIVARKPGKLPGELLKENYFLEYGENSLSIQKKSLERYSSFAIVDDLLATGGTVNCVANILKKNNKKVNGLSIVVELADFNARSKLDFQVNSLITY